jgi:bifunctional DNA-binding transcriptional regulator/antitoxin component of YhaV-PrlF toxin-antitoxin module
VVIPAEHRRALGLEVGDELLLTVDDGSLRIATLKQAVAEAQALVKRYNPKDESLSQSLIRDRRAEARKR